MTITLDGYEVTDKYLAYCVVFKDEKGEEIEHAADNYDDAALTARMTGGKVMQYGVYETERTPLSPESPEGPVPVVTV